MKANVTRDICRCIDRLEDAKVQVIADHAGKVGCVTKQICNSIGRYQTAKRTDCTASQCG